MKHYSSRQASRAAVFTNDVVAVIPMKDRVACVRAVLDGRLPMVSVRRALRMFETAPLLRDNVT